MTNREASKKLSFIEDNASNYYLSDEDKEALSMAIKLLNREAMWEESPPYLPNTERRDCLNCGRDCTGHRFGGTSCDKWEHK